MGDCLERADQRRDLVEIEADAPEASATISEMIGRDLRLENRPRPREKTGIDREAVFSDVPVTQMIRD